MLLYQVKQALLALKQKPAFVGSVVSSMGLTLGVLLCVLSLAYALLIQPLPYPKQNQLFQVSYETYDSKGERQSARIAMPNLHYLHDKQSVFDRDAFAFYGEEVLSSIQSQPKTINTYVSPDWLSMFGADLIKGRMFEQTEAIESYHPVAVISYDTWTKLYGQDENILNQKMTFSGVSFSIIGVLAKDFVEPELYEIGRKTQVYLPWDYNPRNHLKERYFSFDQIIYIGQLKPELTHSQAQQSISQLMNDRYTEQITQESYHGWHVKMPLTSLKQAILGDIDKLLVLLILGAMGLLVIALSNLVNLFLSRLVGQKQLFAVHASIGLNKRVMMGNIFVEALLLMLAASLVALFIANSGFALLAHYTASELPRLAEVNLSFFTVLCAVIFVLFTALLFAVLGARSIDYSLLSQSLKSGGKGQGVQVSKRTGNVLISCQITVSFLIILVSGHLFLQSLSAINQDIGFNSQQKASLLISATTSELLPIEIGNQVMDELQVALINHPNVDKVSRALSPMEASNGSYFLDIASGVRFSSAYYDVDHNYFDLIDQAFVSGRDFTEADIINNAAYVVVNESLAKQLETTGDVIGRKLSFRGNEVSIIGVVKSAVIAGEALDNPRVYVPFSPYATILLIKFNENQTLSRDTLVAMVTAIDARFSVFTYKNLEELKVQRLFAQYVTLISSAFVSVFTMVLTIIGVVGVISYNVQMRRFELGTRLAVGAKGRQILLMILSENAKLLFVGLLVSVTVLAASYVMFAQYLVSLLTIELIPMLLASFALVSLLTVIASYLPLKPIIKQPVAKTLRGN